jgi:hypothetical protein
MCLQRPGMGPHDQQFRQLCTLIGHIFHFEFHAITEQLKAAYAAVDPDSDTRALPGQQRAQGPELVKLLTELLEKGNYERVTREDLDAALRESSLFKIRLQVDFDDFEEVLLFCRGESMKSETVYRFLGKFPKTLTFTHYDQVAVYIKFKEQLGSEAAMLPVPKPGATLLKLYQNVPKADLEMLFPNTQVRMRTMDKLLIGIPALVSGGIVLTTKLGASLVLLGSLLGFWAGMRSTPVELNEAALLILLTGLATLGGYMWRQFNSFKNRKLGFIQSLTKNLYFKNLDNNAGVFHRLVDYAEEEECKEAFIAYSFLLTSPDPVSDEELDRQIESWFEDAWGCTLDFEIDDALRKLIDLQLVLDSDGLLSAQPLYKALGLLDKRWDAYFAFPE